MRVWIEMLKLDAGPAGVRAIGARYLVESEEADHLVAAGAARVIDGPKRHAPEAAVLEAPETADLPTARARG